jgi:hypothetical protein
MSARATAKTKVTNEAALRRFLRVKGLNEPTVIGNQFYASIDARHTPSRSLYNNYTICINLSNGTTAYDKDYRKNLLPFIEKQLMHSKHKDRPSDLYNQCLAMERYGAMEDYDVEESVDHEGNLQVIVTPTETNQYEDFAHG